MPQEPLLIEFVRLFNEQAFYEAHEVLEEAWLKRSGSGRSFYQGLIQCAVALAHWKKNNSIGTKQVGERGILLLKDSIPEREGVDVSGLIAQMEAFLSSKGAAVPTIRCGAGAPPAV